MRPLPWLRHSFLSRRHLDRLFLDLPDAIYNRATGRRGLPPYSLRSFIGGAQDFYQAGYWFREDLYRLNLLPAGAQILDIGCGCGRLARPLAVDPQLREQGVRYTGMDIDAACVHWCECNITRLNDGFRFYQADCHNPSYNRQAATPASAYRFPHPDHSFDLILLTSVFTHLLPVELTHYLSEVARLLAPDGVAYASMFLYPTLEEAAGGARHGIPFPFAHSDYAVNREDFPTNAVAYNEAFVMEALKSAGLQQLGPVRYGVQDTLLLTRDAAPQITFGAGWHPLEQGQWRWTEKRFEVTLGRDPYRRARFRFTIPEAVGTTATRIAASTGNTLLAAQEYQSPGEHVLLFDLPSPLPDRAVRFEVECGNRRSIPDARQLGVQVKFVRDCGGAIQPLHPIALF